MSDGPPLLLPAFLLMSSLLIEDYITSKEGRSGVLPRAASESVLAATVFSFSGQASALCRLGWGFLLDASVSFNMQRLITCHNSIRRWLQTPRRLLI